VTTRSAVSEVEHFLLPHGEGGRLTTIYRWSRRLPVKQEAMDTEADEWLSKVKSVAERSVSPT
jgi:hypothetical protein